MDCRSLLQQSLALADEGVQLRRQAVVCDRLGSRPEAAAEYLRAAGQLSDAAAHCPLAPKAAESAAQLAAAAEKLAGASSASGETLKKASRLYRQAASKIAEAAELCPEEHPNRSALEQHVAELSVRAIYLESLNGTVATVAFEDHVGDLVLDRDIDSFKSTRLPYDRPPERAHLGNAPHRGGSKAAEEIVPTGALGSPPPPAATVAPETIDLQPTSVEPGKIDWLQEATNKATTARTLDSQGRKHDAFEAYKDACNLYNFVLKRDERARAHPRVKQVVRERMEELLTRAEELKANLPIQL